MAAETEKWIKAETEKEMKAKRSVYECDPEKNTECKKTGCLYNPDSVYPVCHLTSKKEYAKDTQMDEHFCFDCKHERLTSDKEPCRSCFACDKWEPKEDVTGQDAGTNK
jgi:hypothetical protein